MCQLSKAVFTTIAKVGSLGFIMNPYYVTHPPLKFRLYFLIKEIKEDWETPS